MKRIAVGMVAVLVLALMGCGSSRTDDEVMTNTAKKACHNAIENLGQGGDYTDRVAPDGDNWTIAVTVDSASGRKTWTCTAIRDGDTVRATVEPTF